MPPTDHPESETTLSTCDSQPDCRNTEAWRASSLVFANEFQDDVFMMEVICFHLKNIVIVEMTKQVETVNLGIPYICVRFYRLQLLAVCHKPLPNPLPTPIPVSTPIPVPLEHLSLGPPSHHSAPRAPAPNF